MTPSDIPGFLLPQYDDGLQMTFFLVMLVTVVATIACAHRIARPESWERKWNRGTPDDPTADLDIEHGSVTDLWHAVATAPEKLAEIMPGMLLVVGLLGTFLGLGLALNSASSILGHSNLADPGAAADSMQSLLGMMQGLGTKFKTSVWGIAGFIILRIWSEATRFDEKRLAWVIGKVKGELERRKHAEAEAQQGREQALFTQIGATAQHIVDGFGQQIGALIASSESFHQQQLARIGTTARDIVEGIGRQTGVLVASSEAHHQQQLAQTGSTAQHIAEKIGQQTDVMVAGSEALHLQQLAQLAKIEQASDGIRAELAGVNAGTQAMQNAMSGFTTSTQEVVGRMGEAAHGMAAGADRVGSGATQLVEAVRTFESQFTEVLDNLRNDLSAAINNLSVQASVTLKEGSSQLNDATASISTALGVLSADVKETMSEVNVSINKALTIQQNAAKRFIESSDTLNTNIETTTGMVEKLAKPIEHGLKAVSESNLRIGKVALAVESSTAGLLKVIPELEKLPGALLPLKDMAGQHQSLLAMLGPLGEIIRVQQAMLELLQEIRRSSVHPHSTEAPAADPVLDTGTNATAA